MTEILGMDEIDQQIVQLIQGDPTLTHTEIATHVNRSQPTIGMRIRKLEDAGVLHFQAGINIKETELYLSRCDISTSNPEKIMDMAKNCPYMINVFRLSGEWNISLLLASLKLEDLDKIVNNHFRHDKEVQKIKMEVITDISENYVIPLNILFESCNCLIE
jgi:DNA-binding Lrp family transcriptional regulator